MLELIQSHWKRRRVCKVKCKGVPTVDMDNVCKCLEVCSLNFISLFSFYLHLQILDSLSLNWVVTFHQLSYSCYHHIARLSSKFNLVWGTRFIGNIWLKWFNLSWMRLSHGETTSKQEAHKLKISIIGIFNPSMRHVSW